MLVGRVDAIGYIVGYIDKGIAHKHLQSIAVKVELKFLNFISDIKEPVAVMQFDGDYFFLLGSELKRFNITRTIDCN